MKTTIRIAIAILFIVFTPACAGCSPGPGAVSPQRDSARANMLLIAKAAVGADDLCSSLAQTRSDAVLAKGCADAYDEIRKSLLIAEEGVEAWNAGKKNDVACATKHAAEALSQVANIIKSMGGDVPNVLIDALKFSTLVSGECSRQSRDL